MRLLLDTHVWLWMLASPERLSTPTRELLVDGKNELLLSAASAWEIAIKFRLGKLPLPEAPDQYVVRLMARYGVTAMPVYHRDALHVAELPSHHRDPFDRLLIAQSQVHGTPIVTADPSFSLYDVEVIPA